MPPTLGRLGGYLLVPALVAFLASRWRAMYDYFDFVAACQFNTDAGTVGNVHSCIVLRSTEGAKGTYELPTFVDIMSRFRKAFLGEKGAAVRPQFRRLCSTAHSSSLFWPYWSTPPTVPAFDASYHFVNHGIAGSFSEVEAFMTESLSTGLDTARPLWQAHFWERVGEIGEGGGKAVFLLKTHHCVADGFSTLRTVLTGCERLDGRPMSDGNSPPPTAVAGGGDSESQTRDAKRKAGVGKMSPVAKAAAVAQATTKMLLLPQDPVSILKEATHLTAADPRVAAANWPSDAQEGISVDYIKEIGRATPNQATVNGAPCLRFLPQAPCSVQTMHD